MRNEKVGELINYYKNKIEEETCISLSNLEPKPFSEKSKDKYYSKLIGISKDIDSAKISSTRKNLNFFVSQMSMKFMYPLEYTKDFIESFFHSGICEEEILYYSKFNKKGIDKVIVNKFCGLIWEELKQYKNCGEESDLEEEWFRGFTLYGENVYFNFIKNIYKTKQKPRIDFSGISLKGWNKINKLIKKYDPKIYFQIPIKWYDFEKELTK